MAVRDSEQLRTHTLAVQRICRGPRILPQEGRKVLLDRYWQAFDQNDFETVKILKAALGGADTYPTPEGDWNAMLHAILALSDTRKGCGYDFNQIILDGPTDGQQHSYTCPQCGVEGFYTAPFEE